MKNKWQVGRRKFLKGLIAAGIMSKLEFLSSCTNDNFSNEVALYFFSREEINALITILNILFPDNGNGPSIDQINAFGHVIWSIEDELYGYNRYELFQSSCQKLEKHCLEKHEASFITLSGNLQKQVVNEISKLNWGDRFLSGLLTYIFEALAIDPLYKVNKNQVGWTWLQHQPGQPQPQANQIYPHFLNKFSNEV